MRLPSDSALIVVDVQNGFVNGRSEHVLVPLSKLLERWQAEGERTLFFTRFHNHPGSAWERLIKWHRLREEPETDLHPALSRFIGDSLVIDKDSYTSLTPEVRKVLAAKNIETLVIAGIATDGCVLKTAVDAFEAGFTPIVLVDCSASHAGNEIHQMGLTLIGRFIGQAQIVSSSELDL